MDYTHSQSVIIRRQKKGGVDGLGHPTPNATTIFNFIYLVFGVRLYAPKTAEPNSANVARISMGQDVLW